MSWRTARLPYLAPARSFWPTIVCGGLIWGCEGALSLRGAKRRRNSGQVPTYPAFALDCFASLATTAEVSPLKTQRLCLFHSIDALDAGERRLRHLAVDLHQRDGGAALAVATQGKCRDVDSGITEQAGEAANEARPVFVADVDHRWRELRVHFDVLDHRYARLAVVEHGAGDRALLPLGLHRQRDQRLVIALGRPGHLVDDDAALLGDDWRGDDVHVREKRPEQPGNGRGGQRLGLQLGRGAFVSDRHLGEATLRQLPGKGAEPLGERDERPQLRRLLRRDRGEVYCVRNGAAGEVIRHLLGHL